ncbi:MAG: RNA polymerase sigma factor [Bacillota bacterium]
MRAGDPNEPCGAANWEEEERERVALLYSDQARTIRRRLRARLGSADEANELLHDAFTRLLGARPEGRVRDHGAFLNRIIRNLLIDRSRRRMSRPVHVAINEETDPAVQPEQGQAIELEQMRRRYREVVESLPPRMREVFVLHRIDGLAYKDIAERLDISIRTVEWHVAQAIVRIGKGLDEE